MNKRIRYRQWFEDHWWHWGFWTETGFVGPLRDTIDGEFYESFQSTGLRDSNGVEIWEGSLIEGSSGKRATVEWNDDYGQWWSVPIDTTPNCPLHQEDCARFITVIGDTTTTPELMEVKK